MIAHRDILWLVRPAAGFVLTELLAVILVFIAVAAIGFLFLGLCAHQGCGTTICRHPGPNAHSQLELLESGCRMYKAYFGEYPPGGAANLVKYLTGEGMPFPGSEGGFRTVEKGRVYGPFVDTGRLQLGAGPDGKVFKDRFGGDIGYWVFDGTKFTGGGRPDIKDPLAYVTRNGVRVVDMFCASAGPKGDYSPNPWTSGTDDIVTFVSEE